MNASSVVAFRALLRCFRIAATAARALYRREAPSLPTIQGLQTLKVVPGLRRCQYLTSLVLTLRRGLGLLPAAPFRFSMASHRFFDRGVALQSCLAPRLLHVPSDILILALLSLRARLCRRVPTLGKPFLVGQSPASPSA